MRWRHQSALVLRKRQWALMWMMSRGDLTRPISQDAAIRLITNRDEDALELVRHDCAHIMAEAVLELFSETQVTIGPAIENGFYYDFYRETSFTPEDLEAIEKRMHEIVDRDEEIVRGTWSRDEAVAFYKEKNEPFKVELVNQSRKAETVSHYTQGNFIDLCRGPHLHQLAEQVMPLRS